MADEPLSTQHFPFPRTDVLRIPYVKRVPRDGRTVPLHSYYSFETNDWHLYLPHDQERLIRLRGGEPISGSYFADRAVMPDSDIELPLGTLILSRMSFPDILHHFHQVLNGVLNCAAVLEKYHVFRSLSGQPTREAATMVETELEYLLVVLRSFYDVLQRIVGAIQHHLVHADGTGRPMMKKLPDSFRGVALESEAPRSAADMTQRWGIPQPLADWYQHEAPFFLILRKLRDGIAHRGERTPTVFSLEQGFGINQDAPVWDALDFGPDDQLWNGRLRSLRGVFAGFILHVLRATTRLADVLPRFIALPDPIIETRLFVRSPFGRHLVQLENYLTAPWETPAQP